jgi:sugar lactone lactonase YvrE
MRMPILWGLIGSLLIAASLAGCAAEKKVERVDIQWPLPPDPPRIRYEKSIEDAKSVLPKKGFLKKVLAVLFGEEAPPHFIRPYGIAVTPGGKLLVSDTELQAVHSLDFGTNAYRQVFKIPGGTLQIPIGVAIDSRENLYLSDSGLGRIFQFNPNGVFEKVWSFQFERPTGIAIDSKRQVLYVADTARHRIFAFNLGGEKLFEFGVRGTGEGEFNFPTHIALHPQTGDLYIADSMNFRIEQFSPAGKFIRQIGSSGAHVGNFSKLKGIAVDERGIIYAVDGLYDTVEMFNPEGKFLMNFGKAGNHEGEFWLPGGIAVSGVLIYVADSYNKRVQVFQLIDASNVNGASE